MKKAKKFSFIVLLVLSFILSSCDTGSGGGSEPTPKQTLTISISDDISDPDRIIKAITPVHLSINEILPNDLDSTSITWYSVEANGNTKIGTGKEIDFTPSVYTTGRYNDAGINKRYTVFASINSNKYKGSSDKDSFIAMKDDSTKYRDYIKAIYKHIDITDFKPGLSVAVYSKEGDIDFEFYHGLAQIKGNMENTKSTQHILGSISKSFTAAAIISLYPTWNQGGNKTLDDYLNAKLSSFGIDFTDAKNAPIDEDATLKELLTHTSSMGDFIGVPLIADLFSYNKSLILRVPIGQALGIDTPSYKLDNWTPAKPIQYLEPRPSNAGTYFYSTAVYEILGLIVEKLSGQNMNVYMHNNLYTSALGTKDIMLAPQDNVDYSKLAHPHEITSSLYSLIDNNSSGISSSTINTLVDMVSEGKEMFDFAEFMPEVNMLFCNAAWCAGAMIGTAPQVARWCYNLLRDDETTTTKSALNNVNDYDVHKVIRESATELTSSSAYGFGVKYENKKDANGQNPIKLYGHAGRTAGAVNYMYYNDSTDTSYVVMMDCLEQSNPSSDDFGIDIDLLIYDLVNSDL